MGFQREYQAALPLFPGQNVSYYQLGDSLPDGSEGDNLGKVQIPVDELGTVKDEKLRDALWLQYREKVTGGRWARSIFADSAGELNHTYLIPRGSLFEDSAASPMAPAKSNAQEASSTHIEPVAPEENDSAGGRSHFWRRVFGA